MTRPEDKTKPSERSAGGFLGGIEDEGRREDALALRALRERLSGDPAVMSGLSIVGCGA